MQGGHSVGDLMMVRVRKEVGRYAAMLGGAAKGPVPGDSGELWEGFRPAGTPVSYVRRRDSIHTSTTSWTELELQGWWGCCFRARQQCWGRLCGCNYSIATPWRPVSGVCVLACPPHPPKGHATSFPPGRDFLSLRVNEGASCHPRRCLSPKVLADTDS